MFHQETNFYLTTMNFLLHHIELRHLYSIISELYNIASVYRCIYCVSQTSVVVIFYRIIQLIRLNDILNDFLIFISIALARWQHYYIILPVLSCTLTAGLLTANIFDY